MAGVRLWILIILALLAAACQDESPQPTRTIVEDSQSELLAVLLKPEDFSSDWTWFSQDTYQASFVPGQNSGLAEKASITLAGRLETNADFILFFEGVDRYPDGRPAPLSLELAPGENQISKTFDMKLGKYGREMHSGCILREDEELKTCKVTIGYAQIILSLSIILNPGQASNQFIEQNIDSWLQIADQRIADLDPD